MGTGGGPEVDEAAIPGAGTADDDDDDAAAATGIGPSCWSRAAPHSVNTATSIWSDTPSSVFPIGSFADFFLGAAFLFVCLGFDLTLVLFTALPPSRALVIACLVALNERTPMFSLPSSSSPLASEQSWTLLSARHFILDSSIWISFSEMAL